MKMTVNELIAMLEPYRGFDLEVNDTECVEGEAGIRIKHFKLGIADVGYSDNVLILDIEEIER